MTQYENVKKTSCVTSLMTIHFSIYFNIFVKETRSILNIYLKIIKRKGKGFQFWKAG